MVQQNNIAEKILHVGIHLMACNGYEATSTREIVEAAGVTKPMLYYYFGSKEGLCKAAIRWFATQFFTLLREKLDQPREPRESLVEFIWFYFEFMRDHRDESLFYMSLIYGPERQQFSEDIEALVMEGRSLTIDFLQGITQAGLLRQGCEGDFRKALHGVIDVWYRSSIREGFELNRPLAERIVDDLLYGFAVR